MKASTPVARLLSFINSSKASNDAIGSISLTTMPLIVRLPSTVDKSLLLTLISLLRLTSSASACSSMFCWSQFTTASPVACSPTSRANSLSAVPFRFNAPAAIKAVPSDTDAGNASPSIRASRRSCCDPSANNSMFEDATWPARQGLSRYRSGVTVPL